MNMGRLKYAEQQRTLFLLLIVFLFIIILSPARCRLLSRTRFAIYIPIALTDSSRYAACICSLKQFQLRMRQILNLEQVFT
jgi:hypothetical protein